MLTVVFFRINSQWLLKEFCLISIQQLSQAEWAEIAEVFSAKMLQEAYYDANKRKWKTGQNEAKPLCPTDFRDSHVETCPRISSSFRKFQPDSQQKCARWQWRPFFQTSLQQKETISNEKSTKKLETGGVFSKAFDSSEKVQGSQFQICMEWPRSIGSEHICRTDSHIKLLHQGLSQTKHILVQGWHRNSRWLW